MHRTLMSLRANSIECYIVLLEFPLIYYEYSTMAAERVTTTATATTTMASATNNNNTKISLVNLVMHLWCIKTAYLVLMHNNKKKFTIGS